MAETMLREIMPEAEVSSAGIYPAHAGERLPEVSTKAIKAMKEIGFDMSKNVITQLTPEMVSVADKVILMGEIPGGPVPDYLKNAPNLETWNVPDPGYGHITTREARDAIREKVEELAERVGSKRMVKYAHGDRCVTRQSYGRQERGFKNRACSCERRDRRSDHGRRCARDDQFDRRLEKAGRDDDQSPGSREPAGSS